MPTIPFLRPVFHYVQVTDCDPHQAPIGFWTVQREGESKEGASSALYIPDSSCCPRKISVPCPVQLYLTRRQALPAIPYRLMARADLNHRNHLRWILVYMRGENGGPTTNMVPSHQNRCLTVLPCSAKEHLFLELNVIPEHVVTGPGQLARYGLDRDHPVRLRGLPLVVAGDPRGLPE